MISSMVMLVAYLFFDFIATSDDLMMDNITMLYMLTNIGEMSELISTSFAILIVVLSLAMLLGPVWILLYSLSRFPAVKWLAPIGKPGSRIICSIPFVAYFIAFLIIVIGLAVEGFGDFGLQLMVNATDFLVYLPAAIVAFVFGMMKDK